MPIPENPLIVVTTPSAKRLENCFGTASTKHDTTTVPFHYPISSLVIVSALRAKNKLAAFFFSGRVGSIEEELSKIDSEFCVSFQNF